MIAQDKVVCLAVRFVLLETLDKARVLLFEEADRIKWSLEGVGGRAFDVVSLTDFTLVYCGRLFH